jgi:hypothetical protein
MAVKSGYTNSQVTTAAYTISSTSQTLPAPTFSPAAGTYSSAQSVTISDATAGTTIYYTTNGTAPTTSSSVYSGPVMVSATGTLEAMAVKSGYTNSPVATAAYTISSTSQTLPAPTFSPSGGSYSGPQSVTISDGTAGTAIHYTTDGTTPTASSTTYTGPITVSASETLQAIAVKTGYTNSTVASAAYTIGTASSLAVCGVSGILTGPASAPSGAVVVPAGDNSNLQIVANTTYYFASGTHTFGTSQYGQIIPASNDTFIGAPNAVLDGKNTNLYAFTGQATGVTIEYLTIQNFGPAGANNNEGVVNHDAGHGWTIQYNTVQQNAGAGVFVGTNDVLKYNCLVNNGQYGFSVYENNGVSNVLIDHNEIAGNNTYHWETKMPGCGCTGGGKFWATNNATITNNYFHDNQEGPGLWADTNNNDFDIENNQFANNDNSGIIYEISYNAMIRNNTFTRNANIAGPSNTGFPTGAIYISESGGDSRVTARYQAITITQNQFTDNYSGVVLWENADRFCNSPANTSSGTCTLVNPTVANLNTCVQGTINNAPYLADCRWKTQNVSVTNNTFSLTPSNIGSICTASNSCGLQGVFSNYGTYPTWSPYQGDVIQQAITFNQNNVFSGNTYTGPWQFMAHDQGTKLTITQWQAAPYNQDGGSTFH